MKKAYVVFGAVLVAVVVAWLVLVKLPALSVPPSVSDEVTATTTADATPSDVATTTASTTASLEEDEGVIEPSLRTLDVKPWQWVGATYKDGSAVAPKTVGDFVMTFSSSGGVSFDTDCNSMSGSYEAYSGGLTFGPIASTKMFCEDSKESEFASLISDTKTYRFTSKGELLLETTDGATVIFK